MTVKPVLVNCTAIPVVNIVSDNEAESDKGKADEKKSEKKKNVQKPASKNRNRTWHKFKTGLLNKMQKHVSPVVVTGRRTVLKAKQKTKNSWHSVTAKTKQEKKKKGLFKCLSKGCKVWKKSKFGVQRHIIENILLFIGNVEFVPKTLPDIREGTNMN